MPDLKANVSAVRFEVDWQDTVHAVQELGGYILALAADPIASVCVVGGAGLLALEKVVIAFDEV